MGATRKRTRSYSDSMHDPMACWGRQDACFAVGAQCGHRCEPSSAIAHVSGAPRLTSYSTLAAPHLHVNSAKLHGTGAYVTKYSTVTVAASHDGDDSVNTPDSGRAVSC